MKTRNIKFSLLLLSFLMLFASCIETSTQDTSPYEKAKVVHISDGDTIKVEIGNDTYKVRMVGIDTPEINKEDGSDDYYGQEAFNFTKEKLSGKTVYLETDISDTDQYARLLRYVWLEEPADPTKVTIDDLKTKSINGMLVANGYAHAYQYPPDDKYYDMLKELEEEAFDKNLGIWDFDSNNDFDNEHNNSKVDGIIRGNKNSMIYHLPGGEGYDKIADHNIVEFKTEDEARRAGYKKARN